MTAAAASADFQTLNGRRLRPDGGYILEIQDKGTSWGLVGSGWADAGLYNFDYSKPK